MSGARERRSYEQTASKQQKNASIKRPVIADKNLPLPPVLSAAITVSSASRPDTKSQTPVKAMTSFGSSAHRLPFPVCRLPTAGT
jgi:hypothetical protein